MDEDETAAKSVSLRKECHNMSLQNNEDNLASKHSKIAQDFMNSKTSVPDSASEAFAILLSSVGDYGKFQWKLMVITGFCGVFTSFHNMGAILVSATPDHWCQVPYFQERNITLDKTMRNITAPWIRSKDGTLKPSECKYLEQDYSSLLTEGNLPIGGSSMDVDTLSLSNTKEIACNSWIYDTSIFQSTVVTEWNLVCNERWVMSSVQASYMMGVLAGAVIFSFISDRIGRRKSSLICALLFFISSVFTSFSSSIVMFLILRFITAGSGQGMFLTNYVLTMECASLRGRTVMGNLYHIFFAIGFTIFPLLGYLLRDWRNLQLACSVPTCILLSYYWLLPESPRWLLLEGRQQEGLNVLVEIAKINGGQLPEKEQLNNLLEIISKEVKQKESPGVLEKLKDMLGRVGTLLRTPKMRRRNLIMFYAWFVTSMIYYGLSFNGANINASLYLATLLGGIIEILSVILLPLLLLRFGRRPILCLSFLVGGISCGAISFVPTDLVWVNITLSTSGKFMVSLSFMLVFMFSAELVPTHVRNISMGMSSMFARFGSGLAPFIVDLLGDVYYTIPSTIFGILSVLAGLLTLLLPETGNRSLPESVEEIESMPR